MNKKATFSALFVLFLFLFCVCMHVRVILEMGRDREKVEQMSLLLSLSLPFPLSLHTYSCKDKQRIKIKVSFHDLPFCPTENKRTIQHSHSPPIFEEYKNQKAHTFGKSLVQKVFSKKMTGRQNLVVLERERRCECFEILRSNT